MAMFLTLVPADGGPPELAARGQVRVHSPVCFCMDNKY
jgi:hypothetical protein